MKIYLLAKCDKYYGDMEVEVAAYSTKEKAEEERLILVDHENKYHKHILIEVELDNNMFKYLI